ncbi:MAG: hypothetical protein AAF321_04720 [Pseudomonadota bacterium]
MPECPGLYELAAMRDGAMARLRLPGGRLTVEAARGLAEADRARNVLASPVDAVAPLVTRMDDALQEAAEAGRLDGLPVKASCVVDSGAGDVIGIGHDVGLIPDGDRYRVSLADRPTEWGIAPEDAPALVVALFGAMARSRQRLTAFTAAACETALHESGCTITPLSTPAPHRWPEASDAVGPLTEGGYSVRVPLGDLGAEGLETLADAAARGDGLLRLAPNRRIVLRGLAEATRREIAPLLEAAGFGTTPEPIRVVACTGALGCPRTERDTRGDAVALARALEPNGSGRPITIHLSGCARGCARPGPSDWLLRAEGDGYALFADACADTEAPPLETVAPSDLPARVAACMGAVARHV